MAGCAPPSDEVVPYVDMPERVVPGEPLRFASTIELSGYGRGIIAASYDGRPTKLEGNPLHPASLGGTDLFMQAEILNLYDPSRSRVPRSALPVDSWQRFSEAFWTHAHANPGQLDLRILSGRITSPSVIRQIQVLGTLFPRMRWHRYEPLNDDNAMAGAHLAFGKPVMARPRLDQARIIWSIGADFLGPGPEQPALARQFASRRNPESSNFSRLYACESLWSLTGANADHRLSLSPGLMINFAYAVAQQFGGPSVALPSGLALNAQALAQDLKANQGGAIVLAGASQIPQLHALAAWLNDKLAAPLDYIAPVDPVGDSHTQSLAQLRQDLSDKKVDVLIILNANPVYDQDREFARLIGNARFSAHLGLYDDETGQACHWHLPMSHPFESWSDLRAPDGTASIVQPLITPISDTRSVEVFLAMIANAKPLDGREIVRDTWRAQASGEFEAWWRGVLEKGVIAGSASANVDLGTPALPAVPQIQSQNWTLLAPPDPSVWDGRFANNAWLQECPKPFSKEVWGNAAELAPEDGAQLGVRDGQCVRLTRGSQNQVWPVRLRAGQARGSVGITLGYGRWQLGPIGNGVGFNVAPLLSNGAGQLELSAAKDHQQPLHTTYGHAQIDAPDDTLFPTRTLGELVALASLEKPDTATLLPAPSQGRYAWAMVIDNALCIGCNACVVACQAENNIPVVGPDEIDRHRDMHWLRIDAYQEKKKGKHSRYGFEPVPCMHCEEAPCEPVCPVEASVHDHEGLNVQVYNRCIGTRFCQANCPYKVRRFNWFDYSDKQAYADLGSDLIAAQRNPDVTVRDRGVMEKCTYCVQRISRARRQAEKQDREIAEGEVVTACQAACPTRAITFGDLERANSQVSRARRLRRHFTLLAELGTKPRTTYLADVSNPNSAWEDSV